MVSDVGGDETGPYTAMVQRLNDPGAALPLAFGGTATASLDTFGEMDSYSFTANAGDVVRARMSMQSSLHDPRVELFDPFGVLVASAETVNSQSTLEHQVASSGSFLVLMSDVGGDDTGAYAAHLQRLNNPGALPLAFGAVATASLDTFGEMDAYSFTADAGDAVRVRMTNANNMESQVELFDDAGVLLGFSTSDAEAVLDVTLASGGSLLLLVSDVGGNDTGPYTAMVQRLNDPGAAS